MTHDSARRRPAFKIARAISCIAALGIVAAAAAQGSLKPAYSIETRIDELQFSPDGKYFSVGGMRLFDAATRQQIGRMPYLPDSPLRQLAWIPGTKKAFFAYMPFNFGVNWIALHDFENCATSVFKQDVGVSGLAVSPNGRYLLYVDQPSSRFRVNVYDLTAGAIYKQFLLPSGINAPMVQFLPDSHRFVIPGPNVFNIDGTRLVSKTQTSSTKWVTLSRDGQYVYSGTTAAKLLKYSTSDGSVLWNVGFDGNLPVQVTADDTRVLYPSLMGETPVYRSLDALTGKSLSRGIPRDSVESFAISPTTGELLDNSNGGRAFTLNADGSGELIAKLDYLSYANRVSSRSFSVNVGGEKVPAYAMFENGVLMILRSSTGGIISRLPISTEFSNNFYGMSSSDDGNRLAFVGNRNGVDGIQVINASTGKGMVTKSGAFTTAEFSGGDRIVAVTSTNKINIYSQTGTAMTLLKNISPLGGGTVQDCSLSPDGTLLAYHRYSNTNGADQTLCVVSTVDGSVKLKLNTFRTEPAEPMFQDLWFNPDGTLSVTTEKFTSDPDLSRAFNLSIYRFTSGTGEIWKSIGIGARYRTRTLADVSPDGKYALMITSGTVEGGIPTGNGIFRIFRVSDGALIATYTRPFDFDYDDQATFSTDSNWIHVDSMYGSLTFPVLQDQPGISIEPTRVKGGATAKAIIRLPQAAGAGGVTVALSDNSSATDVPSSVFIESGKTVAEFDVPTHPVDVSTAVKIQATIAGTNYIGELQVMTPQLLNMSIDKFTLAANTTTTGRVMLESPAGPSGLKVNFVVSTATLAQIKSIVIPPNEKTAAFPVQTLFDPTSQGGFITATIPALFLEGHVNVATLKRETYTNLDASEVKGGSSLNASTTVGYRYQTGTLTFKMTPVGKYLQVPTSFLAPEGTDTFTYEVKSLPVLKDTLATYNITSPTGAIEPVSIKVLAPVVDTLTPSATEVVGGKSMTVTVHIDGPAAYGFRVYPKSTSPATVPTSVLFATGGNTVTFTVKTAKVTSTQVVTVNVGDMSFDLTVKPA